MLSPFGIPLENHFEKILLILDNVVKEKILKKKKYEMP